MESRHPLNSDGSCDYGKLPFDCFVVHHWDDERAVEEDQMQWDELARRWLDMTPFDRKPYMWIADSRKKDDPAGPGFPTTEQASRILAPHQTWEERTREIDDHYAALLLRTCYRPELAGAWESMKATICWSDENIGFDPECILDNEELYGAYAGNNWNRIVLRMPAIIDTITPWRPETGDGGEEPEKEMTPVEEASLKQQTLIFVVDEEALRGDFVKLKWLDEHGNCVWDNKISSETVELFFSCRELGHSFDELLHHDDHPGTRERGAFIYGTSD